MEAVKDGDSYTVLSDTGHTYTVTNTSCTCPHFQHRLQKSGGSCKHMVFVSGITNKGNDEIVSYIKICGVAKYDNLEKEFGKDIHSKLQSLERRGEIIYNKRNDSYSILE